MTRSTFPRYALALGWALALLCAAPTAHAQDFDLRQAFDLRSERTETRDDGSRVLIRDIILETGDTVSLIHHVQDDGSLLLRTADQSVEDVQKMDRLCQRWGTHTIPTGEARLGPDAVAPLPCFAATRPKERARRPQGDAP